MMIMNNLSTTTTTKTTRSSTMSVVANDSLIIKCLFSLAMTVFVMSSFLSCSVSSFIIQSQIRSTSTKLFLEDWVADLIDKELYRQGHKKEYEEQWMEKNRHAVFSRIETDFVVVNGNDDSVMNFLEDSDFRMHAKDQKLAFKDPEKYCADRCVATGNCDIYEDFYEMSPEQVVAFCTECVLSEDEDGECEIPDAFYDKLLP